MLVVRDVVVAFDTPDTLLVAEKPEAVLEPEMTVADIVELTLEELTLEELEQGMEPHPGVYLVVS